MDIAIVTNMMTPYRLPLVRALGRHVDGIGMLFLTPIEANRDWGPWHDPGFPTAVLESRSFARGPDRFVHFSRSPWRQLDDWKPRLVIVGGWDAPAYWQVLLGARSRRIPVVGLLGTHGASAGGAGLRASARRAFVRRLDGVVAYGERAAAYAVELGANPASVHAIGNPVDATAVARAADAFAASPEGAALAADCPAPRVGYIGQLIERKQVLELVDAFARAAVGGTLLLAGSGPLESRLRERIDHLGVNARLLGSLPAEQAHGLFGVLDCVVLPSAEEVWGLVVNEALAAGVYPVVSARCGAAELIRPGENGELVEPSVAAVADGLRRAAAVLPLSEERRRALREEGARIGIEATATRMAAALARWLP